MSVRSGNMFELLNEDKSLVPSELPVSYRISSSELECKNWVSKDVENKKQSPFYRTKWCRYPKDKCPRGTNCKYAHDVDELIVRDCIYNDNCIYITKLGAFYENVNKRVCKYKHPGETDKNFYTRTGIKRMDRDNTTEVIRVREELVIQSVEIALKNGKKNIHIEVV